MNPSHFSIPAVLLLASVLLIMGYGIRYNNTQSLPHTLYIACPVTNLEIGQIVSFHLDKSPVAFAKIVAGVPGDWINVIDNKLYINNVEKGIIVPPFTPIKEGVIPEGFFFALGTHSESFDSRYEIFGLVRQNSTQELLWPVF